MGVSGGLGALMAAVVMQAPPPTGSLASVPGVSIVYYDVSGTSIRQINDSILSQQDEQVSTSSAQWNVAVSMQRRDVDGKCSIADANARFTATVRLPRLTSSDAPKEVRAAFDKYVAGLQARQADDLSFVYSQVPQVADAVRKSSCDGANAAASAAVERIKALEAERVRSMAAQQALTK